MPQAYRICQAAFASLDGEGARLFGGRWNSPGNSVVYMSESVSLATLEYLVHLDPLNLPADVVMATLQIPDELLAAAVVDLPPGLNVSTDTAACRKFGDRWLASLASPLMRVPSALVPEEYNLLLNPRHPLAFHVATTNSRAFGIDPRLLG